MGRRKKKLSCTTTRASQTQIQQKMRRRRIRPNIYCTAETRSGPSSAQPSSENTMEIDCTYIVVLIVVVVYGRRKLHQHSSKSNAAKKEKGEILVLLLEGETRPEPSVHPSEEPWRLVDSGGWRWRGHRHIDIIVFVFRWYLPGAKNPRFCVCCCRIFCCYRENVLETV